MIKNKLLGQFFLVILFTIILAAVYSPSLVINYAHHDDLAYFDYMQHTEIRTPLQETMHAVGRFAAVYMARALSKVIYYVEDLRIIRMISIFQLALCFFFCFQYFSKYKIDKVYLFLILLGLFTLPPFQVFATYAGIACYTPAILLSLLAFLKADIILHDKLFGKQYKDRNTFISIGLLLTSITIYPSAAMFYWAFVAGAYLCSYKQDCVLRKVRLFNLFTVGLVSIGMYAIMLQVMKKFLINEITSTFYNPYEISMDIMGKLQWFIAEPLFNSLNLWSIFPKISVAFILILLILCALLIVIIKKVNECRGNSLGVIKAVGFNSLIFSLLFILSFFPNLVSVADAPWYRCSVGLTSLVYVLVIWSGWVILTLITEKIRRPLILLVLSMLSVCSVSFAFDNVFHYRAKKSHLELSYVKSMIKKISFQEGKYQRIHVIQPPYNKREMRYDEYGVLSTYYEFNILPLFKVAFRELGIEKELYQGKIEISCSLYGQEFSIFPDTLVIDMSNIMH